MLTSQRLSIVGAFVSLCVTVPAQAYVGPGAGITLIGALIGLVTAIFLALWAVLRWPIRRFLARRNSSRSGASGSTAKPPEIGPQ
jgi:hypothetical protein